MSIIEDIKEQYQSCKENGFKPDVIKLSFEGAINFIIKIKHNETCVNGEQNVFRFIHSPYAYKNLFIKEVEKYMFYGMPIKVDLDQKSDAILVAKL